MRFGRRFLSTFCVIALIMTGFAADTSAQTQDPTKGTSEAGAQSTSDSVAPSAVAKQPKRQPSKIRAKAKRKKKVRRRKSRRVRRGKRARKKKRSSRQRWPTKRPKKLAGSLPALGDAPYQPGERLVFRVQMFGAVAGNAILAVGEPTRHRGRAAIPFAGFMRSSEFLNKFYPVKNRLVVLADRENMRPLKTDFYVRENKKVIDYHTTFNHRIRLLHSLKKKKGRKLKRNFTSAGAIHEPLGSIYAIRRMALKPGDYFQRYIWDGRKERLADIRVVRRETLTVPAGVFDTLRIEIRTRITGGFIRSTTLKKPVRKGTIWIAQDRWRTPVKMLTPTKLGDAEAVLIRRYMDGDETEEGDEEEAEAATATVTPESTTKKTHVPEGSGDTARPDSKAGSDAATSGTGSAAVQDASIPPENTLQPDAGNQATE